MKLKVSGFVTFYAMYTMANIDTKIYVEIEIRSKRGKCYDYTDMNEAFAVPLCGHTMFWWLLFMFIYM